MIGRKRSRSVQATLAGLETIQRRMAEREKPGHPDEIGWSQEDLMEKAQVSLSTVKRFLSRKPIDRQSVILITQALGLKPTEVIDPQAWNPLVSIPGIAAISGNPSDTAVSVTLETASVPASEFLEGPLAHNSPFYIPRSPIEQRCCKAITHDGCLIRIKAPCQMGKTSLVEQILACATRQGYRSAKFDLQFADTSHFVDLDRFLRWFAAYLGQLLGMPNRLKEQWDDIFGSKVNCTDYLETYLLPAIATPLVLCLDDVDLIFKYEKIAADFFGLLRAWFEKAKTQPVWGKLRLVLAHSTEAYIPMQMHQSPFNVGLAIDLPELTTVQIQQLAQLYGLDWNEHQIQLLMSLVGGHPHLVRQALYCIAQHDLELDTLLQTASTESGLYVSHLRRQRQILAEDPALMSAMREAALATQPVRTQATIAFRLQSLGLVRVQGNGIIPRCNLYRDYFRDDFIL